MNGFGNLYYRSNPKRPDDVMNNLTGALKGNYILDSTMKVE